MMGKERFTVREGKWYALEFIGDEFFHLGSYRYSPIQIINVHPLKTGQGIFILSFFHANYPQGVNDKTYKLKTIERGELYILAASTQHNPKRIVHIFDITYSWFKEHFPGIMRGINEKDFRAGGDEYISRMIARIM